MSIRANEREQLQWIALGGLGGCAVTMIALRRFRKIPTQHPGKLFLASLGGSWIVMSLQQWNLLVDLESRQLLAGEMVNMAIYTPLLQAQIDVFEGGWRRELRGGFCRGSDWYAAKRSLALVYEMESPPEIVKLAKKALDDWSWVERLQQEVGLSSTSQLSKDYMERVNGKVDAELFHRALSMQVKASRIAENEVAVRVGEILRTVQLAAVENWAPEGEGELLVGFGGCRLYRRESGDVIVPWSKPSALSRFVAATPPRSIPMTPRWDGMIATVPTTDPLPQQPRTDVDWVGLFRPLVQRKLWPNVAFSHDTEYMVASLRASIRFDCENGMPYWCDTFVDETPNISVIRTFLTEISSTHVDQWMQAITGSSSSSSSITTLEEQKKGCWFQ